jgi:hypothetical protein
LYYVEINTKLLSSLGERLLKQNEPSNSKEYLI